MSRAAVAETTDQVADVLRDVRVKGVRLWAENGQLRYTGPKGALNDHELARLKACRVQLVALLEKAADTQIPGPGQASGARPEYVPLAFSQQTHLNTYQLLERPAIRQVAFATRLRGRLDVEKFQRSLSTVVRRHEALRTRIVVCNGVPMQRIDVWDDYRAPLIDLTDTAGGGELEAHRQIEGLILDPVDITVDPLFVARLLKLREDEHVLVVAMEHLISDAASRDILLRDLLNTYTQALRGQGTFLPVVATQMSEYADWQSNAYASWQSRHGEQWNQRLNAYPRVRFPEDVNSRLESRLGVATVSLRFGTELRDQLQMWSRQRGTTAAMSAFTAYAALVLRWCDVPRAVIRYQSDGRARPEVEHTVGCFASTLYIPIEPSRGATYADLLELVTHQYCGAYEQCDFTCMVAAQVPRPEFTRNTCFNWVPAGLSSSALGASEYAITPSPFDFRHPMHKNLHPLLKGQQVDHEPSLLLYEQERDVLAELYFPLSRFSMESMSRFGNNFINFIRALLSEPQARIRDLPLT